MASTTVLKIKNEEGKKESCQLCHYQTDEPYTLKRHVKAIHAKIKDHSCSACGRCFSQESSLKRHVSVIHLREKLKQDKHHFCSQCEQGFYHKHGLEQHTKSVHLRVKDQECDVCGEDGASVETLEVSVLSPGQGCVRG